MPRDPRSEWNPWCLGALVVHSGEGSEAMSYENILVEVEDAQEPGSRDEMGDRQKTFRFDFRTNRR